MARRLFQLKLNISSIISNRVNVTADLILTEQAFISIYLSIYLMYVYIYIYMCVCVCVCVCVVCFSLVLWNVNHFRLFYVKFIFVHMNSSI